MGQGYSSRKLRKSTPNDVLNNLVWSLDELIAWEDQCDTVRDLLAQEPPGRKAPVPTSMTTTGFDFDDARRALEEIDQLLSEHRQDKRELAKIHAARESHESGELRSTGVSSGPVGPSSTGPSTTTGIATMGERGAVSGISSSGSISGSTSAHPSTTTTTGAGSGGGATTTATAVSTASDPMSPVQAPASKLFAAVATEEVATTSEFRVATAEQPHDNTGAEDDSDTIERKRIAAKYLFIHGMLDRLLKSAQYTYKLKCKLDHTGKRIKSRRAEAMQELELMQARRTHEELERALANSLSNFDKTRSAVGWLLSDYELSYALYKSTREVATIKQARDRLQHAGAPSTDAQVAISSLDHLLYQFQARRHELELAMQQNERDSLTVGLNFLDVQQRGCIEPKEAPELSARLFALLDLTHDGVISHDDLQKSIVTISDKLEDLQAEIYRLEQENAAIRVQQPSNLGTLQMAQNQDRLVRLRQDVEEEKHTLKAIYRYFHVGFSKHVFNKVEGEVTEKKVDLNTLFDRLRIIDEEGHQDPLHLPGKEELHRQLQRASLGAGALRELRGTGQAAETAGQLDTQARAGLGIDRGAQAQVQQAVLEAERKAGAAQQQHEAMERKYDQEQQQQQREQEREKRQRELAEEREKLEEMQRQKEQQQQAQQQQQQRAATTGIPPLPKVVVTATPVSTAEVCQQQLQEQQQQQQPMSSGETMQMGQIHVAQATPSGIQQLGTVPAQIHAQVQPKQEEMAQYGGAAPSGATGETGTTTAWTAHDEKPTASRSYTYESQKQPSGYTGGGRVLPESESRAGYEQTTGEPRTTQYASTGPGPIGSIAEEETGEESMTTPSGTGVETSTSHEGGTSSSSAPSLFQKLERMLPTSMQSQPAEKE